MAAIERATAIAPELPYIHRIRPASAIIGRLICAGIVAGIGVYLWPDFTSTVGFLLIAAGFMIWAAFAKTVTFLVTDDGLTVVRQTIIRIGGSFDYFAPRDIRRIRYRTESHPNSDPERTTPQTHYILDLVATDSRTHLLFKSVRVPFDRNLGKKLAAALNVAYEEYLDEP